MIRAFKFACFSIALMVGFQVHAASITWSLNDVIFFDGRTASGTFDFDASSQTYSNVDISTTSGPPVSDFIGNSYISGAGSDSSFTSAATTLTPIGWPTIYDASYIELQFQFALTNSGGAINLVTGAGGSAEIYCDDSNCNTIGYFSGIESGFVSAPAVPIPAAAWLFSSGLIGLIGVARRQKS